MLTKSTNIDKNSHLHRPQYQVLAQYHVVLNNDQILGYIRYQSRGPDPTQEKGLHCSWQLSFPWVGSGPRDYSGMRLNNTKLVIICLFCLVLLWQECSQLGIVVGISITFLLHVTIIISSLITLLITCLIVRKRESRDKFIPSAVQEPIYDPVSVSGTGPTKVMLLR